MGLRGGTAGDALTHVTSSSLAFDVTFVTFFGHLMQPLSWETASVRIPLWFKFVQNINLWTNQLCQSGRPTTDRHFPSSQREVAAAPHKDHRLCVWGRSALFWSPLACVCHFMNKRKWLTLQSKLDKIYIKDAEGTYGGSGLNGEKREKKHFISLSSLSSGESMKRIQSKPLWLMTKW